MTNESLVIPLGKAVSEALAELLVNHGKLDPSRCLLGFPHPSGQTGIAWQRFGAREMTWLRVSTTGRIGNHQY